MNDSVGEAPHKAFAPPSPNFDIPLDAGTFRTSDPSIVVPTLQSCGQRRCASCCPSRGASSARFTLRMVPPVDCSTILLPTPASSPMSHGTLPGSKGPCPRCAGYGFWVAALAGFRIKCVELVYLCKHWPGFVQVLKELGMKSGPSAKASAPDKSLSVMLDGKVLGTIPRSIAGAVISHIRGLKAASYVRFTNAIPGSHARSC